MKKTIKLLEELISHIEESKDKLESKIEILQNTFDERSEKWQESEKGDIAREKIEHLEDKLDELDTKKSDLEMMLDELIEFGELLAAD